MCWMDIFSLIFVVKIVKIYHHTILGDGGSPGLVVMGGDSYPEGCGFTSQLDIFSHLLVVTILMPV